MLNFDNSHKTADMSSVKSKIEKAKVAGKVLLAGAFISGCIMFGNYIGDQMFPHEKDGVLPPVNYSAVVQENDHAMIVDLNYYTEVGHSPLAIHDNSGVLLVTPEGDRIVTGVDSVTIFDGDDAHEKAENYAQSMYQQDGQITYYESIQNNGISK